MEQDSPIAAEFYRRIMKSLEDEATAHIPKVDDILAGTTESIPDLTAAEQYVLADTLAEGMKQAQTRVNEATWKGFCNNVGLFIKEHFTTELQIMFYHLIWKRHGIPFASMSDTVLFEDIAEHKDILRRTI